MYESWTIVPINSVAGGVWLGILIEVGLLVGERSARWRHSHRNSVGRGTENGSHRVAVCDEVCGSKIMGTIGLLQLWVGVQLGSVGWIRFGLQRRERCCYLHSCSTNRDSILANLARIFSHVATVEVNFNCKPSNACDISDHEGRLTSVMSSKMEAPIVKR